MRLRWVFSMAEDMCGSHHPDRIDADRELVRRTRLEVLRRLRAARGPKSRVVEKLPKTLRRDRRWVIR